MSMPSALETLEGCAADLGIGGDDLFRLWFSNHASEDLQRRFNRLSTFHQSPSALAIDLIDDVVDVWLKDREDRMLPPI